MFTIHRDSRSSARDVESGDLSAERVVIDAALCNRTDDRRFTHGIGLFCVVEIRSWTWFDLPSYGNAVGDAFVAGASNREVI